VPYGTKKSGRMTQVFNKETGKVYGSHASKKKANKQLAALHTHTNEGTEKGECPQCDIGYHRDCDPDECGCSCHGDQTPITPQDLDAGMSRLRSKLGKAPKMAEIFAIKEAPTTNLAQQVKTATPVAAANVTQQSQKALANQRQTLAGVAKTQGATVKMAKTDVNNPVSNVFVTKPDGSADVLDNTTGQLKPVPGIGQSKPTDPLQNTGIMGTK